MTPDKRREVSSLGGKAVKAAQRSFSQNRELARAAGRKGGLTPRTVKAKLTQHEIETLADDIMAKVPHEA